METFQLAVVRLVLRQKLPASGSDVAGIAISDFLVRDLTLRQACDLSPGGSTALLEFVWSRGLRSAESERWSVGKILHTEPHYARWAFTQAMVGAVRQGDLVLVQWLRDRFPNCPIYVEVLGEACKCGRLEALQLLRDAKNGRDIDWRGLLPNWAAEFGHWDVVHWVYEQHHGFLSGRTLECALRQSNSEIKWLTAHGYETYVGDTYVPYSEETWPARRACIRYLIAQGLAVQDVVQGSLQTAAEGGDLQFFQWLLGHQISYPKYVYELVLKRACEHGHIQVVQCLLTRMEELSLPSVPSDIMRTAARSGQLALVHWIYELHGRNAPAKLFEVEEGSTALEAAAENGHLEVVQFLHRIDVALKTKRKRAPTLVSTAMCTTTAMNAAACAGHLAVVEWLHSNRSEGCTAAAMDGAATKGHLDVVKWLHSNRSEGCTSAAMDGVAGRVFHEPGCRRTLTSCCVDKRPDSFVEDQITMLEWLNTNRSEGCSSAALDMASRSGNFVVLKWLHANTMVRPSSADPMEAAASDGRLDIVKWLHAAYPECCTDVAMIKAAEHGHLDVVKWLNSNFPGNSPGRALIAAAGNFRFSPIHRQLEVVQYLLPNCAAVDVASAMGRAMDEIHFDIVLLLHTQHPTLTCAELQSMKTEQSYPVRPSSYHSEMRQWIDENYPSDLVSE
jgi:ankyrin repeat protein